MPKKDKTNRLTTAGVCKLLNKTPMTIYNYRMGLCAGKSELPYKTEPMGSRQSIYFLRSQVISWAKKNNVEICV